MPTISVKDGAGTTQTVNTLPAVGQTTASASLPVALSTDDRALLTTPALPTGAATASGVAAVVSALGTPLQAGGSVDTVIKGTATDRGASVGTTAMTLAASNTSRRGFSVQNQSTTATIYISSVTTATADFHSLMIPPLGYYESQTTHVGTGAISCISSAATTSVYSREW